MVVQYLPADTTQLIPFGWLTNMVKLSPPTEDQTSIKERAF